MNIDDASYDLAELAGRADVSVRTVRYYIQQGLLPSPERGPGARYGREHLDRLRLVRRLQREHLPLAEIRRRLEGLTADEVRQLVAAPSAGPGSALDYIRGVMSEPAGMLGRAKGPPPAPMPQASSQIPMPRASTRSAYNEATSTTANRSQWDRITLAPDVELHIRRPLSREQNRQVERLLQAARDIFEEETP